MATTDEELQTKQEYVANLRQEVADVNADREKTERELTNDITASQLDTEAAGLEKQLVEAKRLTKALQGEDTPEAPPVESTVTTSEASGYSYNDTNEEVV